MSAAATPALRNVAWTALALALLSLSASPACGAVVVTPMVNVMTCGVPDTEPLPVVVTVDVPAGSGVAGDAGVVSIRPAATGGTAGLAAGATAGQTDPP